MLKNYLKTSWRNLAKNKGYSAIKTAIANPVKTLRTE